MIYTPQKNPKQTVIMILVIVLISILGSVFIHEFFALIGLLFWIQYTAILSYKQFKKGVKYKFDSITHFLLYPQFRFFLFILLAVYGIFHLLIGNVYWAYAVLVVWLLFALNFYFYYTKK